MGTKNSGILSILLIIILLLPACTPAAPAPTVTPSPLPASSTPISTPTLVPTPTYDLAGWTLFWGDEFNGPDGSSVDTKKWTMTTGGWGWGNAELENYTDRPDNVYIENPTGKDGVLVLKAQKENYEGREYTSGRLNTQGKFEQMYGRFEARMQIPYGQGIWPAFWMLGAEGGWPYGGEIDIMENIGKEPNIIHATLHGPGYSGGQGLTSLFTSADGQRFADAYHVFAVEWEPNAVRWYVDNQLYKTRTPADLPDGTTWVFDHPFYLLINLAVGGSWPQFPDETTVFPQYLKVDYVRVYTRTAGFPTHTPTPVPPKDTPAPAKTP